MLVRKLPVLILAAAFIAHAASAQVPRGFTPQGADQQRLENNTSLSSKRYQDGVAAIKAKNFQVAEGIFDEYLRQNPTHPEGNLMMGTTKMSLGKWEEAKKYLDVAARKDKKNPDPKSRLAVTLIKLGDMEGAMQQRAELEKMSQDCKGKCRNAAYIAAGLAMIDSALPKPTP
jgi:tetratricopeptide (TPR) repeat protein